MALSILDSAILVDPVKDGATTSAPLAGIPYALDVCWGPAGGDTPAASSTALSCPGATIDTSYSASYYGHAVGATGRTGLDMGWTPDNTAVYLSAQECALGFWRITFPTAGDYTITLDGIGTIPVTVTGTAPVVTAPTIVVNHPNPLNRQASKILAISFSGTYPSGGLDLTPEVIGLYGMLHADVQDTALYRFRWAASKLIVYTNSGEVSGALTFATTGLFIGSAG